MDPQPVLEVDDLKKTFKVGFARKVVDAVKGISFAVGQGEIFGFLGPNGAGKTTTIKMCMDLIRPTAGRVRVFGGLPGELAGRLRVGYLPEQPYFYDYLRPGELLDFYARLYGVPGPVRRERGHRLLARVGLDHARGLTLRRFSKGMLQRFGFAQALMGDPELVVLDEPLSGLDPIGRKEMKDLIVQLKGAGKTVFFSSHILSDVELLCDRIAIVHQGRLKYSGPLQEFLRRGQKEVEVVAAGLNGEAVDALAPLTLALERMGGRVKALCTTERCPELVRQVVAAGGAVEAVLPRSETLEEIFVRLAQGREEA
jgi:ABC-2 type transport system ATP-binding protein